MMGFSKVFPVVAVHIRKNIIVLLRQLSSQGQFCSSGGRMSSRICSMDMKVANISRVSFSPLPSLTMIADAFLLGWRKQTKLPLSIRSVCCEEVKIHISALSSGQYLMHHRVGHCIQAMTDTTDTTVFCSHKQKRGEIKLFPCEGIHSGFSQRIPVNGT